MTGGNTSALPNPSQSRPRPRRSGPWFWAGPWCASSPAATCLLIRSATRAAAATSRLRRRRKAHAPPSEAAHERGRGRHAETPAEIPARGWKDIAWRVYEQFTQDRVMSVAAGVTYNALLALFPAVAALVSIYGLFADPGTIESNLSALAGVLPGGALEIIGESGQTHRFEGWWHARVWLHPRLGYLALDCECGNEGSL